MRDIGFRFFVFGLEAPIGLTLPLEVEVVKHKGTSYGFVAQSLTPTLSQRETEFKNITPALAQTLPAVV